MRKNFRKWLFLCVAASFLIAFSLSCVHLNRRGEQIASDLIEHKLEDAANQLQTADENTARIQDVLARDSLAKARLLANIIEADPSILNDLSRQAELVKRLDVDEIHVSDDKGILVVSYPPETIGYDMNSRPQSSQFMPAVNNQDFSLPQELQPRGVDGRLFKYTGVARLDQPGIVQIGYYLDRVMKTKELDGIQNLALGFRIGNTGKAVVFQNGKLIGIDKERWLQTPVEDCGFASTTFLNSRRASGLFHDVLPADFVFPVGFRSKTPRNVNEPIPVLCRWKKAGDRVLVGMITEEEIYGGHRQSVLVSFLFFSGLLALMFAVVSKAADWFVFRGIQSVNRSLDKITAGDLDEKVNVRPNAELASLSDGINTMVAALKDSIAETAARIDKELEFARNVQINSLPNLFPPYPDRTEFDIFATMNTAKEVGGDFYDFMLVNDHRLGVIIADVSGKGIPAALFMMTSKTLLKNFARSGYDPSGIFVQTNNRLFEDHSGDMFVTALVGVLEPDTGRFLCSSAGHNRPILRKKDGSAKYLDIDGGIMLGGVEGVQYAQTEIFLEEGDRILFYTDGVTEAFNESEELYGDKRLLNSVGNLPTDNLPLDEMIRLIRKDLLDFTGDAEQLDDITMLVLAYNHQTLDSASGAGNVPL